MEQNPSNKAIDGKSFHLFLRDDGILQTEIEDNTYFTMEDAEELIDAARIIGGGKRFRNLIITGDGTLVDSDARAYSSTKEGSKYKIADAFVISSYVQQLIANFIIKVHNPVVPTAYFRDKESAIKWLKKQ